MDDNAAVLQSAQRGNKRSQDIVAAQMPAAPSSFWMTAWTDLATMRPPAQNFIASIPHRAITEHAEYLGLSPLMEDLFVHVIRAVDNHFVNKVNGKMMNQAKRGQ